MILNKNIYVHASLFVGSSCILMMYTGRESALDLRDAFEAADISRAFSKPLCQKV